MSKIPELELQSSNEVTTLVAKDQGYRTLNVYEWAEIIRIVEERPQIIDLLTYFYHLPCHGISSSSQHLAKLELAKPYIEGKPCKKCKWKYDDIHDFWETNCGKSFTLIEGDPKDNGVNFCPYCGKELWQLKAGHE